MVASSHVKIYESFTNNFLKLNLKTSASQLYMSKSSKRYKYDSEIKFKVKAKPHNYYPFHATHISFLSSDSHEPLQLFGIPSPNIFVFQQLMFLMVKLVHFIVTWSEPVHGCTVILYCMYCITHSLVPVRQVYPVCSGPSAFNANKNDWLDRCDS